MNPSSTPTSICIQSIYYKQSTIVRLVRISSPGSTNKQIAIDNVSNTNSGVISVNHKIVQTQTIANSPGSTNIQVANNSAGNFVSDRRTIPKQTIKRTQSISQNQVVNNSANSKNTQNMSNTMANKDSGTGGSGN